MGIQKITGLDSNLDYEILNYSIGEKICNSSQCSNGIDKIIRFRIKYKDNMYNEEKTYYNAKSDLTFNTFKRINYSNNYIDYVKEDIKYETIKSNDFNLKVEVDSIDNIFITTPSKTLIKNTDYIYENNTLTVFDITEDITISYTKPGNLTSVEKETKNGVEISAEWYDNNSAIITISGHDTSLTDSLYIRLREGNIAIETIGTKLYSVEYASNPMYKKGDNVFIRYEYLSGDITDFTHTFTIKYRNTSKSCTAISTAELIANHSKENFKLDSSVVKSAVATTDISKIGMFFTKEFKFNEFKFKVTYGIVGVDD